MSFLKTVCATVVAGALVVGCGGGGGGGNRGGTPLTREQVMSLLADGLSSTHVVEPGGGGEPNLTRSKREANYSRLTDRKRENITRDHEGGDGDFWFSDTLGLWVQQIFGDSENDTDPTGFRFYEDHEKTVDGGHELQWIDSSTFPIVGKWELKYLKGTFAGEEHSEEWTNNEDSSGTRKGKGHIPNELDYSFSGEWSEGGLGEWQERVDFADGTWMTYDYDQFQDLTERLIINSSTGLKITFNFAEDWSGTGKIEGNGADLPADLEWDFEGNGTITWADGSTTPINIYDLMG